MISLPWDAVKANPALSVRVAAGEMDSAVSRRDLHTAISSADLDAKASGLLAYVLRSNLHHQALSRMKIL